MQSCPVQAFSFLSSAVEDIDTLKEMELFFPLPSHLSFLVFREIEVHVDDLVQIIDKVFINLITKIKRSQYSVTQLIKLLKSVAGKLRASSSWGKESA